MILFQESTQTDGKMERWTKGWKNRHPISKDPSSYCWESNNNNNTEKFENTENNIGKLL